MGQFWYTHYDIIYTQPVSISKAIYSSFTGISPTSAAQICDDASLNGDIPANELHEKWKENANSQYPLKRS